AALPLGERRFNALMHAFFSPWVLALEMLVLLSLLYHLFNGLRMLLVDAGLWIEDHRDMLYVAIVIILALFGFHAYPLIEAFIKGIA
ncbi:MAG: hypothetical protein JXA71_04055, partial [Chitinispirillaceae bacterium]|nr:hypothetical protein [Chitinispirillaceae bacterium]